VGGIGLTAGQLLRIDGEDAGAAALEAEAMLLVVALDPVTGGR
jgi:hypothetical protein